MAWGLILENSPINGAGKSLRDYHKEPLRHNTYLSGLLGTCVYRVIVAYLFKISALEERLPQELLNISDLGNI